ncbi:MAG: hypothetical protein HY951_17215 [Bacteroidia bacterium]|nr:hypothetical protein [Bacteroidia bacterium]
MKKLAIIIFIFSLVLQFSCKKEELVVDNDYQSVIDDISADNAVQSVFSTVNSYALVFLGAKQTNVDSNIIVSITPLYPLDSFPKTLILDYCNGINCSDGKLRKGKLIAVINSKWEIEPSSSPISAEITTNNYYENNVQIIGTFSVLFNGFLDSVPSFTLATSNAELIFENGKHTQWSSSNTTKWVTGLNTIDNFSDDVFLLSGNKTGINCNGKGYESNITSSLKFDNSCLNSTITQGKLELIPQDIAKRIIDFGNGECDRKAMVTINGISVDIDF